jgi:hypothetical protein
VENATGGVGAAELRLTVDDPAVASIESVTVNGDPGLTEINRSADGSRVDIAYAMANTTDEGRVSLLTVTVAGEATGTTDLSISPRAEREMPS